ncbi:MAG: UDP-N-acetylmuramate dehydrogenase [Acholeplasmataceae bacterium]
MNLINIFKQANLPIESNIALAPYTSLKIGGAAEYFISIASKEMLHQVLSLCHQHQIKYHILGNGSNTLVLDYGVKGLVIHLGRKFSKIELLDETTIKCDAGALLKDVCLFALDQGLTGMESLYGIPASIGGALYMNAGAYDGEMRDIVKSCEFIDKDDQLVTFNLAQCELSYRHSYFMNNPSTIISVTFSLKKGNPLIIKEKMDDFMLRRATKQPLDKHSAGSTFKRPPFNYASALIDQCGLKGFSINDAAVSSKHAGFLINENKASSKDFISLIAYIEAEVYLKTGFKLQPEIQILK